MSYGKSASFALLKPDVLKEKKKSNPASIVSDVNFKIQCIASNRLPEPGPTNIPFFDIQIISDITRLLMSLTTLLSDFETLFEVKLNLTLYLYS